MSKCELHNWLYEEFDEPCPLCEAVAGERQRILKLLEKMDIEIHYTTWFDAQGNIINSITSPETLDRKKVFALIKGEN